MKVKNTSIPKSHLHNDEKSFESQDDYLNKELIQTNQNIKDIETISTQVCFNSDKIDNENENNYDNEEYIDTTEIFDFQGDK